MVTDRGKRQCNCLLRLCWWQQLHVWKLYIFTITAVNKTPSGLQTTVAPYSLAWEWDFFFVFRWVSGSLKYFCTFFFPPLHFKLSGCWVVWCANFLPETFLSAVLGLPICLSSCRAVLLRAPPQVWSTCVAVTVLCSKFFFFLFVFLFGSFCLSVFSWYLGCASLLYLQHILWISKFFLPCRGFCLAPQLSLSTLFRIVFLFAN